jgi:hypothetical protein
MNAATRKGHPSECSLSSSVLVLNLRRPVVFGAIVLFATIEVYLFLYPLPFLTNIVDVYSSMDNCPIQCSSQFPERQFSGSCPLYLVRLSLDDSLEFCVFGALLLYDWTHVL